MTLHDCIGPPLCLDPALKETLNKWLRGRIAALRGVGFGRELTLA
ncbi:MAG: hypothetical protein ACUVSD_01155 [Thiobacillaceae bacterium]